MESLGTDMYLMFCLLSWTLLGYLCSKIALKRGRNPIVWFALGAILGLLAVIALYMLPKKAMVLPAAGAPITSQTMEKEVTNGSADDINRRPPELLWYYLDKEDKQYGPMSFYALQKAWDDDQIIGSTYVWNEEMDNWKTLENLPDLLEKIRRV